MKSFFNKLFEQISNNDKTSNSRNVDENGNIYNSSSSGTNNEKKMNNHVKYTKIRYNQTLNDSLFLREIGVRQNQSKSYIPNIKNSPSFVSQLSRKTKSIVKSLVIIEDANKVKDYHKIADALDEVLFNLNSFGDSVINKMVSLHFHFIIKDVLISLTNDDANPIAKKKKSRTPFENLAPELVRYKALKEIIIVLSHLIILPEISSWCFDCEPLMDRLFHTMKIPLLLDTSVSCINNILLSRPNPFNLSKISNLNKFMDGLSTVKLFMFLKILSACVFPPDPNDATTIQQSITIRNSIYPIYCINHSILLNSPNIIEKSCILLKKSMSPKWVSPSLRKSSGFYDENDWNIEVYDPIHFTNEHLNLIIMDLGLGPVLDDAHQFLLDYTRSAYQSEILVFLYSLTCGSRKIQVLKTLHQFGFLDTLLSLVKEINWSITEFVETETDANKINPAYIKKIQALRMIILYFDIELIVSVGDCPLISQHEKNVINGLEPMDSSKKYWIPTIFDSYIQSKNIERERNFLTCCVQSSLRVPNCNIHEYYSSRALPEILFSELVTDEKKTYQMNFDLFGELIKYNKSVYLKLNEMCLADKGSFEILKKNILENIGDANVFIRGILLTHLDLKEKNQLDNNIEYVAFNFVYYESMREIMEKLISTLDSSSVHLENLCCLNTFLIFIVKSKDEGCLEQCLSIIDDLNSDNSNFIPNAIELFGIWRDFYSNSKDCFAMQFALKFSFVKMKEIVDLFMEKYNPQNINCS